MDILQALEQLDAAEKKANPKSTNKKFVNPLRNNSNASKPKASDRNPRGRSLPPKHRKPPSTHKNQATSPKTSAPDLRSPGQNGSRSPSVASTRRISFVEDPRTQLPERTARRLRIPTKSASLASGFPFDPKLKKHNVGEEEWKDFCNAVIEAANIPKMHMRLWAVYKDKVIKRIGKELQYNSGDIQRTLNQWNRHFQRKGFSTRLEVPGPPKYRDDMPEDERLLVREQANRFRFVITPNAEKAGSIYSRTSSLTRSVTGEGVIKTPVRSPEESEDEGGEMDEATKREEVKD